MDLLDLLVDSRFVMVGREHAEYLSAALVSGRNLVILGEGLLDLPEDERVEGTAGAVAWLVGRGAHIARVHDVKQMVRVVRVVDAIARAGR